MLQAGDHFLSNDQREEAQRLYIEALAIAEKSKSHEIAAAARGKLDALEVAKQ